MNCSTAAEESKTARTSSQKTSLRSALLGSVVAGVIGVSVFLVQCSNLWRQKEITTELWHNAQWVEQLANLELGSLRKREFVSQTEVIKHKFPLVPEVESKATYEVQFDVTYTYFVSADVSQWSFTVQDGHMVVKAPALTAGPPAIDTATIRSRYEGGWLVIDEAGKLDLLKSKLSEIAEERALQPESVHSVRAHCREALHAFISSWIKMVPDLELKSLTIQFEDEADKMNAKIPLG